MTIYNTNPSSSDGGGSYDFMEDAEVGLTALLPAKIADDHVKWTTDLQNNRTEQFGTFPDMDNLTDFHVAEQTSNVSRSADLDDIIEGSILIPSEIEGTYMSFETSGSSQLIYEIVFDKITETQTKTFLKTAPNLNGEIKHISKKTGTNEYLINIALNLFHYNFDTNTTTNITSNFTGNFESITTLHYNNNLSKFVIMYIYNTNNLYTYTTSGISNFTLENSVLNILSFGSGDVVGKHKSKINTDGTDNYNYNNNKYYYSKAFEHSTLIIEVDENNLNTEIEKYNYKFGFSNDFIQGVCFVENTLFCFVDYIDFANNATVLKSVDNGDNWNEIMGHFASSSFKGVFKAFFVKHDYFLAITDRDPISATALVARCNLYSVEGETTWHSTNFQKGTSDALSSNCILTDNSVILTGNIKTEYHEISTINGEGVTFPILENLNEPQLKYALKHTK